MKIFSAAVLTVLLSSAVWAQGLPKFDAPLPSKDKILQMHYSGFNDWATQHAPASNEMDYDGIAAYYAGLRTKANAAGLADKPTLRAATSAVRKWSDAYYSALYDYMGGGTLYTHSGNRSEAALADVEAQALERWVVPPKPAGRLESHSFAHNYPKAPDEPEYRAKYAKSSAAEAKALHEAQSAIAKLPLGARTVFERYIYRVSTTKWGE